MHVLLAVLAVTGALGQAPVEFSLHAEKAGPCVAYGVSRLEAAFKESVPLVLDKTGGTPITVRVDASDGALPSSARKPEGYRLVVNKQGVTITGYDDAGAMYGCLDLAQRVRDNNVSETLDLSDAPTMSLRGTCILLMKLGLYDYPLTPKEFPFFYDKELWTKYLDFLAENRFNYIAFWNGHPFDYFVKLDKYPEAQDGLEPGLLERNHAMLMWLGQEAQKRNIWLMFEFYNIHVSVYFAKAHKLPEHGINKPTPLLTDYTGYCIERFVSEFPSVGLYICPGESLEMKYTPDWINNVIFDAVKRTGKTPPIMIRSWGIDLDHMKQVVGHYPRLYTERKFNVEMIAGTDIDPENADWAKLSGNHVVNIHCMGNLEPFRWSPPSYIQKCVQSSVAAGATGLHLYPRKAWRWPYGCDRTADGSPNRELQWDRDWMWFEAWGRYAWNEKRDPEVEKAFWLDRLQKRYGTKTAAESVLTSLETVADVLPGIQRLVWLGNDNHTVVSAGIMLDQFVKAPGIPFLPTPGIMRIPEYIDALKKGEKLDARPEGLLYDKKPKELTPAQFLAGKRGEARKALDMARAGVAAATENRAEAERIKNDVQAVGDVASFYCEKLGAAKAEALFNAGADREENGFRCIESLEDSVTTFKALTDLTRTTYESISDVPAWNPVKALPCPYHWSDLLPVFQQELAQTKKTLTEQCPEIYSNRFKREIEEAARGSEVSILDAVDIAQRRIVLAPPETRGKDALRPRLLKSLGLDPMPAKTPLNARTTGKVEYPDYTLEKILYEAWPGIEVPAHLYLPKKGSRPLASVLYSCGHWYNGKSDPGPRSFCVGMVRNGIAVLIYDPMGQGERFAKDEHGHLFPILCGLSQEGFMAWESIRSVDYLETRPDIDGKKIGMTGASGGGLNTVFTAAIEDRFAAVAPVCYPTTFTEFLKAMNGRNWNGGVDLCNQVPGVLRYARMSDLMACVAPKPQLQISATLDIDFPIAGARQNAKEVAEAYAKTAPGKFSYVEVDAKHGYDQKMREAAYGFFLKALAGKGDGGPVAESAMEFEPWNDPKLRCFPDGQNHLTGPLLDKLVRDRLELMPKLPFIVRYPGTILMPPNQSLKEQRLPFLLDQGLQEGGFQVAGTSDDKKMTRVLIVSKKPVGEVLASPMAQELAGHGFAVWAMQPVTREDTTPSSFEVATDLWMLGGSLLGEWRGHIAKVADRLRDKKICLIGTDGMAEVCLLDACDPRITRTIVDRPLISYRELIHHDVRWDASYYIPGLRHVDLWQFAAGHDPQSTHRKLMVLNPINGKREPCSKKEADEQYVGARVAFEKWGARDALKIVTGKELDAKLVLEFMGESM